MGKLITLIFGLAILLAIVITIYRVVPKLWRAWQNKNLHKYYLNKNRIAYDRSHDLLALILVDPKVASLVHAGLEKHAEELQKERLSEDELAELAEESNKKKFESKRH